jgi:hypothetical protein
MSETNLTWADGKETRTRELPSLTPGTIVTSRSLVVDSYGTPWWIDPDSMTCSKVEVG